MADYPIPPWLAPQNPVPLFLQGFNQGSDVAARQNQAAVTAVQMQQQQAQQAFQAANQMVQLQLQRDTERRRQEMEAQQVVGLQLENQQKAGDMAAQFAQQQAFQKLKAAGADDATAFAHSLGVAPLSAQTRFYSQQAAQNAIAGRQQKAQDASIAARTGIRIYDDSGAEIPGARDKAYAVREQLAQPIFQQKVAAYDKAIRAVSPNWTDEDTRQHEAAMAQAALTGKPPQIAKKVTDSIEITADVASATKRVLDEVEQFNKKYGQNAFDDVIGPLDARVAAWKVKLGTKADQAIKDANKIFNDAGDVVGEFKHARYGSALSIGELNDFQNTVSPKESNNFLSSLQSFAQRQDNKIKNALELHPESYYPGQISPEIRKRFSGAAAGTLAEPASGQASAIPPSTQRVKDKVYDTPRGKLKWTGTGWVQP